MLVIGHRGARGLAPENTLASLQSAMDHNVDGIEIDVRVTGDSVPVLAHDDSLTHEGRQLQIASTDIDVLQQAMTDLATLDEALNLVQNKVPLILEIKPDVAISSIVACLERFPGQVYSISSFDFGLLTEIKKSVPSAGVTVNEKWSGVRATYRARKLGTKHITMNQRWLWSGFIRSVTRGGYKLSAYTVNDPHKAKAWEKAGLHAVITDFPDRFQ